LLIQYSPTHFLRPAVRGQTNRYNGKIRLGRGFTLRELRDAGVRGVEYARSIGLSVDLRRKDTSNETLKTNVSRIRDYLNRIVLYPRHTGVYEKKPQVAEAKEDVLRGADANFQNTHPHVLTLPQPEAGYSWTNVTKDMQSANVFKTLRTELKTSKGFYVRLENAKKKALEKKK
jgi:large subunit ribosomal protein L13e